MRTRSWWAVFLLLWVVLAACETVDTETPAVSQGGAALGQPTRTVKPIVSFTPRFTATPIPSQTPLPSNTPIPSATLIQPSATPTATLTVTPTVEGIIQAETNVNMRSDPSFSAPVVQSLRPGTLLGVLGQHTDAQGYGWYDVSYLDEDGTEKRGWVRDNLVDTTYDPNVQPPVSTPAPNDTPSARTPAPTQEPNSVNILAYCRQKNVRPPTPTTEDKVYIEWSWFVAREDLMAQHLQNANYEVRLDGDLLDDWSVFAADIKLESGVWIVYWYYPVGKLSAGEHEVTYLLTWDEAITDGYQQFGPDTPNETNEGNCTFTVTGP